MASKRASAPAKRLLNSFRPQRCASQTRTMATHTSNPPISPEATLSETYLDAHLDAAPTEPILQDYTSPAIPPQSSPQAQHHQTHPRSTPHPRNPFLTTTTATLHAFPSLEPTRFATYPSTHLLVPLRKDILHRAVIYEGDATRQGTANTKWRSEVHGSNRKIRPQKGTGSARLGDKKSPMLKGGGVAFGPKPRDFATGLNRRVYDLAWRIALSYRYRTGNCFSSTTLRICSRSANTAGRATCGTFCGITAWATQTDELSSSHYRNARACGGAGSPGREYGPRG